MYNHVEEGEPKDGKDGGKKECPGMVFQGDRCMEEGW